MDDSSKQSANPKADLVDRLKSANNILVTVSRNPSVDQLASCIALTLLLNKQGKHAAAVFSGQVPSTLEFLQPEETLEKNTDSLRDFIIALDKSKADKLRYKVEDQVVRIFITPYRTSISEDDLDFSQGDFNVDVVVGLGVQTQDDIDEAITAHGRILHDASVTTINNGAAGDLGNINWNDATASSLCELVTGLGQALGKDLIDQQIATALLTGIVAETARFSNEKTTSATMNISATLMAAGANQQLVASRLDDSADGPAIAVGGPQSPTSGGQGSDGSLDINHGESIEPMADDTATAADAPAAELPAVAEDNAFSDLFPAAPPAPTESPVTPDLTPTAGDNLTPGSRLVTEPPALGGTLTANTQPEGMDPATDPLSLASLEQNHLLSHNAPLADPNSAPPNNPLTLPSDNQPMNTVADAPMTQPVADFAVPTDVPAADASFAPAPMIPDPSTVPSTPPAMAAPEPMIAGLTPPPPAWVPPSDDPFNNGVPAEPQQTLTDLEASVRSGHLASPTTVDSGGLDAARDEVSRALSGTDMNNPEPIQALNAQPMTGPLHADPVASTPPATDPLTGQSSTAFDPSKFGVMNDPELPSADVAAPSVNDPTAPPPVPPPIPFQFGAPSPPPSA